MREDLRMVHLATHRRGLRRIQGACRGGNRAHSRRASYWSACRRAHQHFRYGNPDRTLRRSGELGHLRLSDGRIGYRKHAVAYRSRGASPLRKSGPNPRGKPKGAAPMGSPGTNVAASSFYPGSARFPLAPNPGMNMHSPRYIVENAGEQWKVVRGAPHRRFDPNPTKTQAVCAAIELAENDGDAGAEVLVRHEDGYFVTEWVHGQDPAPDKAARPRPS